jgi:two-component system cell cycle response regulator DivK
MEDRIRILLVEDNDDNMNVYRTILEYDGFDVLEARDGEAGIHEARSGHPDLILMDISIPKIDGYEATRILKADPVTRRIPIIALTAHALDEDRRRARVSGCDGFLAKPIAPRRVVSEIRRYLGRDGRGGEERR